jgi:hypothetical protein
MKPKKSQPKTWKESKEINSRLDMKIKKMLYKFKKLNDKLLFKLKD